MTTASERYEARLRAVLDRAPDAPVPFDKLERLVHSVAGCEKPLFAVEMPGGASTRRFFRVALGRGASAVAMYAPGESQEISKTPEHGSRWPFLEVRELLEQHGVRVPRVLAEACEDGFLLVEDLGDLTLANFLLEYPETRELLYRSAVRDLSHAQRALADLPLNSIVRRRAFDHDLLRWELEHFRQWALEARGILLDDAEREAFARAADYIASTIAAWPRTFVHRDYQSRNLMVQRAAGGELQLVWVDFQDAMLGPRVYDLVALLTDSYQTFEPAFIEARLDEYAASLELGPNERRAIGREFDLVTVQRKLKDAGRFVFIERVNGNADFLRFVDGTVEKARRALERLADPKLEGLVRLLSRVVPSSDESHD